MYNCVPLNILYGFRAVGTGYGSCALVRISALRTGSLVFFLLVNPSVFLLFYHRKLNLFCNRIRQLMGKRTMVKRQCMRRIPSHVNMNMGVTASGLLNIGK
jgi:hypothetical protein